MAGRAGGVSFRPRPCDPTAKLVVLRSLDELDADAVSAVQRPPANNHAHLDRENEEVLTVKPKGGTDAEIPTPEVWNVASYAADYKPVYRPPPSYLRAGFKAGGEIVEYDLDNDDEDWLAAYNGTQQRLPAERLEVMMLKLEEACAQAQAQSLLDLQASAAERSQPPPSYADKVSLAANTACLSREAALDALGTVSQRPAAIEAVYAHWLAKRKRLGKPVLRRLQQPPAVTDPNPFAVFRPREKANRPQTRRRRENDSAAYHRMQKLRLNLDHSRAILEWLQRRERRKRDILLCEMESQQMQLRMRHDPRVPPPQAAPAAAEPSKQLGALTLAEQPGQGGAAGRAATQQLMDAAQKREKRRRRDGRDRPRQTDHAFVPPPELPEPEMPFLCAPELEMPGFQLPGAAHGLCGRARFGRGGRLVIDVVDPLTQEPILTKVRRPKAAPSIGLPAAEAAVAMEN